MTRKRKDYRELKVSSFSGYGYKSAPMLRIQGLWLEELGFNIGDQQTVARLWRQGQTEGTVSVIHIVTDGTVDERILKALEAKDLTQSALIDAVKAEVGDGK